MRVVRISGCCADEYRLIAPNWTLRFQGANCGNLLDGELIPCGPNESAEIAQKALTHFAEYRNLDEVETLDAAPKPSADEVISAISQWIVEVPR